MSKSEDIYDYFEKNFKQILEDEIDAIVVDHAWALDVIKKLE